MEQKIKRVVIISGAPHPDIAFLKEEIRPGDYIITADAGLEACLLAGFEPNLAVGDFDTYQPEGDRQNLVRLPAEKDWTDTYYACQMAVERGAKEVHLFCAIGSRVDHTYANFLSLHYLFDHGIKAVMRSRQNCAFFTEQPILVPKSRFRYLSLFAFLSDVTGLTLRGVQYPLTDHFLSGGSLLCVSNEIVGDIASITLQKGKLLVLLTND